MASNAIEWFAIGRIFISYSNHRHQGCELGSRIHGFAMDTGALGVVQFKVATPMRTATNGRYIIYRVGWPPDGGVTILTLVRLSKVRGLFSTGSFNEIMLMSIRNRILLFAALVTLLPSIGLGWIYFKQTERALLQSAQQGLRGTVTHVQRELDLWFKERYYELRVFSNSYLVSEGLRNYLALRENPAKQDVPDVGAPTVKLESYLSLVRSQFDYYRRLLVFERSGNVLAQNPQHAYSAELPSDWQDQLDKRKYIIGEVYLSQRDTPSILVAVPILSSEGAILGFLAAEIQLDALSTTMTSFVANEDARTDSAELLLVRNSGKILLSTREPETAWIVRDQVRNLFAQPYLLSEYVNSQGVPVVGILAPVPDFSWGIVMEKRQDQIFSVVIDLRNKTLLGISLLVALIGFFAYRISRGIVSPLAMLTEAAGRVADGNLDVKIPVKRHDELGATTTVFNDMVNQLQQSRERLELLSTTDSLTQLANRSHIMEKLKSHLQRFRRSATRFSVLLIDVDHFKRINDSAGHLAGDEVLRHLGKIFNRLLRAVDRAGRYGGEEFLIILDETEGKEALQTAERIRIDVESNKVKTEEAVLNFTVSIGVAEIGFGEAEDQLIKRADAALYQAKQEGRNRSVLAQLSSVRVARHPTAKKVDRT